LHNNAGVFKNFLKTNIYYIDKLINYKKAFYK